MKPITFIPMKNRETYLYPKPFSYVSSASLGAVLSWIKETIIGAITYPIFWIAVATPKAVPTF